MKAHELLADQSVYSRLPGQAQAVLGNSVHATSPQAVKWSLSGAIMKCYPDLREAMRCFSRLDAALPAAQGDVVRWSRKQAFDDIRRLLKLLDI